MILESIARMFDRGRALDLSLSTRAGRGCLIVQVDGVLDLATTPDVRNSLQHALDTGAHTVVLDLAGVRFLDSTGLALIVWLHKQLLQRGGRVCIATTAPGLLRVFALTSVDRLIRIYDGVEAAQDDLPPEAGR